MQDLFTWDLIKIYLSKIFIYVSTNLSNIYLSIIYLSKIFI